MDTMTVSRNSRTTLLHLQQGEPRAMHAVRGTVVGCLSGHLWITHEGHAEDYMVSPGCCYSAGTDGLLLVNATEPASTGLVYWTDPLQRRATAAVTVDSESRRRLIQSAHALRQQAMSAMGTRLMRRFCRRLHGLLRRLGSAIARHVQHGRYSH